MGARRRRQLHRPWRDNNLFHLLLALALLGASCSPLLLISATSLLTSPSAVSTSGSTTIVDLKFFNIATHGWSQDAMARIKASTMGGGSAFRELNAWWQAASTVLGQLESTAWELELDELLMGQGGQQHAQQQQDASSTGEGQRQAEAQASAAAAAAASALVGGSPEQQMLGLMQCVNEQHRPEVAMSWEAALAADMRASVRVVGAWWHANASHAVQALPDGNTRPFPVTVVTSASMSRLPQLYAQCLSWAGPLSAVLYVGLSTSPPANASSGSGGGGAHDPQQAASNGGGGLSAQDRNTLRQAALQVSQFMLDMEHERHACKPHVVLVYERYLDDSARQLLYPCNIPRNLARLQVSGVRRGEGA